jgi:hypothetical protein
MVDELMDSGSIAVSKFTTSSVVRVAVSDCGTGETDVMAGELNATKVVQRTSRDMAMTRIGRISILLYFQ